MGTTPDPVGDFVSALRDTDRSFASARDRILAAQVPDTAFGRLFEARAVHDAYRQRLPEMARNLDEARAVLTHLTHALEATRHGISPDIPRQGTAAGDESAGPGTVHANEVGG